MGILSTREWATVIWVCLLFLYVITRKAWRKQLLELGKIFFCKKLLVLWGAVCFYILGITLMLSKLPCWKNIYIKDVVFWFLGSGLIYCINANSNEADEKFIRKILKESFHFTIIFEFIVNTFTFNIWIELAIIPITTILIMIKAFVDQKKNYKDLQKLLNIILALGGFLAFGATFIVGLHEYRKLNIFDTFVSFAIPFIYLVLIIPLVYMMILISKYKILFSDMSHYKGHIK